MPIETAILIRLGVGALLGAAFTGLVLKFSANKDSAFKRIDFLTVLLAGTSLLFIALAIQANERNWQEQTSELHGRIEVGHLVMAVSEKVDKHCLEIEEGEREEGEVIRPIEHPEACRSLNGYVRQLRDLDARRIWKLPTPPYIAGLRGELLADSIAIDREVSRHNRNVDEAEFNRLWKNLDDRIPLYVLFQIGSVFLAIAFGMGVSRRYYDLRLHRRSLVQSKAVKPIKKKRRRRR
jgi:hypothetical protein